MDKFKELDKDVQNKEEKEKAKEQRAAKRSARKKIMDDYNKKADQVSKESEGIWQNDLEMIHTYGYGKDSNLIQLVKGGKGQKRELGYTATIVGYQFKNVSDHDIPYKTKVYTREEDGQIKGTEVDRVAKPGDTIILAKYYTGLLLTAPEFCMVIKNATLIRASNADTIDIDELLSRSVMKFNPKVTSAKVNDDFIKISVSEIVGSTKKKNKNGVLVDEYEHRVLDEYFETFGWLDAEQSKESRASGKDRNKALLRAQSYQIQERYAAKRAAEKEAGIESEE